MNKRILVTGANGTIGLHLLRELKQTPWHVRALVRSAENARLVSSMGAEAVRGDFAELPSLSEAMAGIDTLVLITSANPQAAQQASAVLHAALESGVAKWFAFRPSKQVLPGQQRTLCCMQQPRMSLFAPGWSM
ncbi:NAD(P)H azoreductase [Pseudovibrio sp. Ad13]|uniref:SDR family oxidoreductase n=1 Tax=Pseudovibrio sp. Ad13 TaxID=989396 RepID=UPI0007B24E84|nr:NAD(P)H-binding protein [Pseudovibrio sp. Ad13]KZK82839.1 NAD(P)H azoreductase [Pseudovibrio sp. Ad13]